MPTLQFLTRGLEYVHPALELVAASADAFPPLKSATGGALWISIAIKVCILKILMRCRHFSMRYGPQEFKSNQKEWIEFAEYIEQAIACVVASVSEADPDRRDPNALRAQLRALMEYVGSFYVRFS